MKLELDSSVSEDELTKIYSPDLFRVNAFHEGLRVHPPKWNLKNPPLYFYWLSGLQCNTSTRTSELNRSPIFLGLTLT